MQPKVIKNQHYLCIWAIKSGVFFKPHPGCGRSPPFCPWQKPEIILRHSKSKSCNKRHFQEKIAAKTKQ